MDGIIDRMRALIAELRRREPTIRFAGGSSLDGLPPVIGPDAWSYGLTQAMADGGSAWYFDRQRP
jgi:hypothetical protein